MKSNCYDTAAAPAGCAISLIHGKTHFCSLKIPVASEIFHSSTTNTTISNVEFA